MILAVGYSVCYDANAFTTYVGPPISTSELEYALAYAKSCVLYESDSRWYILDENAHHKDTSLQLFVVVPDESNRREQLLAAVELFEKRMTDRLRGLVNRDKRTIEDEPANLTSEPEGTNYVPN